MVKLPPMSSDRSEISDLIVNFDPDSLARLPVDQTAVVEHFHKMGNARAARVVAQMPARNGALDPDAVDRLLVKVHREMQRLAEEFHHGRRLRELLVPIVQALRKNGIGQPIRMVDIGCGTGYAVRWLAMHGALGEDVELIGADYNTALIQEAERLAALEHLRCRFVTANVFRMSQPAHIYFTTGVVHHFRGEALTHFFAEHNRPGTHAFLHFDFQPTPFAPLASWFFHVLRMRTALARHDGVVSVMRAYSGEELAETARRSAPGFLCGIFGGRIWNTPLPRVFHTLVGIRPELRDDFLCGLGRRMPRMGALT
ncbi:MAG TPA: class I SAM-dependent methyltransferase [Verrucomicrobiae bacterium]|nr:class I SAM-dependent methyltransferase [Verrucomicrobiae bacterium]